MGEEEARALGINVGVMQNADHFSAPVISASPSPCGLWAGSVWSFQVGAAGGRILGVAAVAGMLGATYLLGVDDLSVNASLSS